MEAQAAMCVLNSAWTASLPLAKAEPALKPNQLHTRHMWHRPNTAEEVLPHPQNAGANRRRDDIAVRKPPAFLLLVVSHARAQDGAGDEGGAASGCVYDDAPSEVFDTA